jgi:hypothetical protein
MEAPYVAVKYPYVGGTKWNFMKWADIPDARDENRVYLRRLRILQTPWFALYLHFIYLPDEDRAPHDHPFGFLSLIVRGGYTERLYHQLGGRQLSKYQRTENRTWRRGTIHTTSKRVAHMIWDLTPGTVTLVVAGRKKRDWGFWTEEGFVPWQQYNRAKYDELG